MCSCSEYKFKGHLNSTILKHSVILKQLERILFSKTFFFIFEQDFIILFYNRSIKASSEQRGTIKSFFIAACFLWIYFSKTQNRRKVLRGVWRMDDTSLGSGLSGLKYSGLMNWFPAPVSIVLSKITIMCPTSNVQWLLTWFISTGGQVMILFDHYFVMTKLVELKTALR